MSRCGGGARGPRIKYHPWYVPFENATSFSILSGFYSFASRRLVSFSFPLFHSLSLSLFTSLTYSPSAAFLTRVCQRMHGCHPYSQIRRRRRHGAKCGASRSLPSSFQRVAVGAYRSALKIQNRELHDALSSIQKSRLKVSQRNALNRVQLEIFAAAWLRIA